MTPIERVARACAGEHLRPWETMSEAGKAYWLETAKAAIAAMLSEAKESFATDAQYASLWLQAALDEG